MKDNLNYEIMCYYIDIYILNCFECRNLKQMNQIEIHFKKDSQKKK